MKLIGLVAVLAASALVLRAETSQDRGKRIVNE